MKQPATDPAFADWLSAMFTSVATREPQKSDEEPVDLPDDQVLAFLTELFTSSRQHLQSYSNSQISEGLWFLTGFWSSSWFAPVGSSEADWTTREICIKSIYSLFRDLFNDRCARALSDGDRSALAIQNPLNGICYMFWDLVLDHPVDGDRVHDLYLEVLGQILSLDNIACQESAVHGLEHLPGKYQIQVDAMIAGFIAQVGVAKELCQYALLVKERRINHGR